MRAGEAIGCSAITEPGVGSNVDRIFFSGDDVTIVEAVELDRARPDFFSPWCAILTFRDGKIIQDHTDLEPNRRPGIESDVPYFVSPRNLDSRRQADA